MHQICAVLGAWRKPLVGAALAMAAACIVLATTEVSAQASRPDPPAICNTWRNQWGDVSSGSEAASMQTFLTSVPTVCRALRSQIETFIARRFPPSSERLPTRVLRAGDRFRDCADCPEMVVLPSGTFTMGSTDRRSGNLAFVSDLYPRQVRIRQFAVGRYEVTRRQYAAFAQATERLADGNCRSDQANGGEWTNQPNTSWRDPGFSQSMDDPVVCVSWEDARAYVDWLNTRTAGGYRLLSEAEWEYAARGGTETRYYWGDTASRAQANYGDGNRGVGDEGRGAAEAQDQWVHTAPVGQFQPNAFGLYDMLGNVWERVQDCYTDSNELLSSNGAAFESYNCPSRTYRGGGWQSPPNSIRSASRSASIPTATNSYVGFRVARSLVQSATQERREPNRCDAADAAWGRLRASNDRARIEAFINETPAQCPASGLAQARIIELSLPPRQEFDDCGGASWCPRMVVVPSGSFVMGAPPDEMFSQDERPQHQVNVRRFAAGKFEVTFDQWAVCVSRGGCISNPAPNDQGWGRGNRPVINVSWNDAQEYVRWLSRETHQPYRLLTESEWEYAARASTTTSYYTGAAISASQVRFNSSSTVPVGSYPSNPFGLYDMSGNVWEWVEDCFASSYTGLPVDGSAWAPSACSERVARGGGWGGMEPFAVRSAIRAHNNADQRWEARGFRVARPL